MSDEQVLKRRKKEVTDKAIRDGGFYGKNGVWNSIITFSGDNRLYRERVETIIVKDRKEVFVKKKINGDYYLPGGSTEKDLPHIEQAINECHEEAHMKVKNIESTGLTYKVQHETPNWAKRECECEWQGTYTEIYVAEYDGKFTGHIDDVDQDPFIQSGRWYTTKECFTFFRKEHREALLWYLKNTETEEVTESYVSNYFKNKKFLKKISHSPEIEKSAIDQIVSMLKKEYGELSSKSKIQRERKRADVAEFFHPVVSFDFSDGYSITIAICFDDSSITDGCAVRTEDYGDIVIVYPCFFKSTKENQIYTILHEIGHIRLNHLDRWNSKTDIFGNDRTLEYRQRVMKKGKAMYPEVNADLYAILNGASMYAILNSHIRKDVDNEYDYRFTNSELATRYHGVFNQYNKLKGFYETSLSTYDIACLAIYEMTYQNPSIDFLSDSSKDELYSILYEYCINRKINETEKIKELNLEYQKELCMYEETYEKYMNKLSDGDGESASYYKEAVMNSKQKVDKLYMDLTVERGREYQKSYDVDITKIGNNPQVAYISESKKVFIEEAIDMLDDMILCLENKVEEDSTSNADHFLYIIESLTKAERDKIPQELFGIPDKRMYPLDTKKHFKSAIKLFYKAPEKYKKELATNIIKRLDEFNMSIDDISSESEIKNFV